MKSIALIALLVVIGQCLQGQILNGGNSGNSPMIIGTNDNENFEFEVNGNSEMILTKNGRVGQGILQPSGFHELNFCNDLGLIITKFDNCATVPFGTFDPIEIDIIGGGIIDPGSGGENPPAVFTTPFSFLTGHTTTLSSPLYTNEEPLLWGRKKITPISGGSHQFDTKFIVMPDGGVGINIAKPRAALDVRGSNGKNRPAAIFGTRALGTQQVGANGLWQYHTQQLQFVPRLSENGFNQISQDDDMGFFFTDGQGVDGANQNGSLIIAPWVEGNNAAIGGMRMDKDGNTEFHGNLRATKLDIDAQWWSDFVFEDDYELMSINEVDTFIQQNGHLPDMPSEAEVLEKGIDVAEMMAIQQQKIEELTLYIIELRKEMDELKAEENQ